MSTWIYLECLDHDPPLQADDESGQHLYDLPRIRKEIEERERLVAEWGDYRHPTEWTDEAMDAYFEHHSATFLRKHVNCRIGIRDEYGREYPINEKEQEK